MLAAARKKSRRFTESFLDFLISPPPGSFWRRIITPIQVFVQQSLCRLTATAHDPARSSLGSPIEKTANAGALLPHQVTEFAGIQVRGVRAKERFHSPLYVGRFPRPQAISPGDDPIVAQRVKHVGVRLVSSCRRAIAHESPLDFDSRIAE